MIAILTGPLHAGKTTFLRIVIPKLQSGGLQVGGYATPSLWSGGRVEGYDLVDFGAGGRLPFLRREGRPSWPKVGPFLLIPQGLRRAVGIIRRAPLTGLLAVDEVGRLELQGGGVRKALDMALAVRTGPTLLVVRETILASLLASLGLPSVPVVDFRMKEAEQMLQNILVG
jgi:nucleoside-triphosphatase THEP1